MKHKLKIMALLIAATLLAPALHADLRIVPMAGLNATMVAKDPEPTDLRIAAPEIGYTAGAMIGFKTIPALLIETGFLYNQRKHQELYLGDTSGHMTYEWTEFEIPFLLRLNLAMFSIGAGGFYTSALSDITTVTDRLLLGKSTTTASFSDARLSASNYGLLVAAGLDMKPPGVPVGIIADVRYRMPLKELSTDASVSQKNAGFEFLIGVAFYL